MSKWYEPKKEDIDITEDGNEIHIYLDSDDAGAIRCSIKTKDIQEILSDFKKNVVKKVLMTQDEFKQLKFGSIIISKDNRHHRIIKSTNGSMITMDKVGMIGQTTYNWHDIKFNYKIYKY